MRVPDPDQAIATLASTWPPAAVHERGPWRLLDNAASAIAPVADADIDAAEAAMRATGRAPLFRLRAGEDRLDAMLAARGYALRDPTQIHALGVAAMAGERVPHMTALLIWPPLARMREIWAAAGITHGHQAVMDRAEGPKTAVFARHAERPAGVAFVAGHGPLAMVHALDVVPELRRQGVATNMLRAACHWAQDNGMTHLALAVTRANGAATALCASLGAQVVENYHHRALEV